MKRHYLLISLLALSSICLADDRAEAPIAEAAAASDSPVAKATSAIDMSQAIQPRIMGAKWLSRSTYFGNGKAEPDGVSKEEVVRVKVIDGVTCYQIKSIYDWRTFMQRIAGVPLDPEDTSYFWEYLNEKGSHDYSSYDTIDGSIEPQSLDDFNLSLPYPVEKGHTYAYEESKWEVIDTGVTVETPAGKFDNVYVYELTEESEDYKMRMRFYQQPGVGLVQLEWDDFIDGKYTLASRDALVSYELQPGKDAPAANPSPEGKSGDSTEAPTKQASPEAAVKREGAE